MQRQVQISKAEAQRALRQSRRARERWLRLDSRDGCNPVTGRPRK